MIVFPAGVFPAGKFEILAVLKLLICKGFRKSQKFFEKNRKKVLTTYRKGGIMYKLA